MKRGSGPRDEDLIESQSSTSFSKSPQGSLNGNKAGEDRKVTDCSGSDTCRNRVTNSTPNHGQTNKAVNVINTSMDDSNFEQLSNNKTKGENSPSETRRRSSSRLQGKRPKLTEISSSDEETNLDSDDDCYEVSESKKRTVVSHGRSGTPRKTTNLNNILKSDKNSDLKREGKAASNEKKSKKNNEPASKVSKEFTSGAFVVLKSDFHSTTTPPIWRIDGKALLQKYTHFEKDGQILYKNTSTYSGWVANNKDQYYPVTIQFISHNRLETVVKFLREAIVADDSD